MMLAIKNVYLDVMSMSKSNKFVNYEDLTEFLNTQKLINKNDLKNDILLHNNKSTNLYKIQELKENESFVNGLNLNINNKNLNDKMDENDYIINFIDDKLSQSKINNLMMTIIKFQTLNKLLNN